ncbi:hypothetical protein [Myroides indicus]|uniref:Phage repressor protein C with HTH and peptisase S24 domain n=1 Tax=Myroides indicus TaxID=1323422 RepID=A0A4R7EV46_9FLAO|nr:hypothetical protein [Myroides indicus]TDS57882.1 hypothetical protein C8P70_11415 [Myroides indicus]
MKKILAPIKERILLYIQNKGFEKMKFFENLDISASNFRGKGLYSEVGGEAIAKILSQYKDLNPEWLLTGNGLMLKDYKKESSPYKYQEKTTRATHLPPCLDNTQSAINDNLELYSPEETDTDKWFPEATATIRYHGSDMLEFPPGCILTLKEIGDKDLIVWGQNYCVETAEYRLIKKLQKSNNKNFITAYSSNPEQYADGKLIHEPIDIPKESIKHLFKILGYIVKT